MFLFEWNYFLFLKWAFCRTCLQEVWHQRFLGLCGAVEQNMDQLLRVFTLSPALQWRRWESKYRYKILKLQLYVWNVFHCEYTVKVSSYPSFCTFCFQAARLSLNLSLTTFPGCILHDHTTAPPFSLLLKELNTGFESFKQNKKGPKSRDEATRCV